MIKTIAMIKRKADLSREEFVKHYEEVHAPLALKHLPMIKQYVRNHLVEIPGMEGGPDFDCITEIWMDSLEDAMELFQFVQSDEGQVVRDDEDKLLDREKTVFFLVDEKVSEIT